MRPTVVYYISTLGIFFYNINITCSDSVGRSLSRHKRYIVFPEGSSLTVAFCITMGVIEVPTAIFAELINFGINYDLPNRTLYHLKGTSDSTEKVRRRYRRELYNKVEIIMNAMGYDGKSCVYKALCEVVKMFDSRGENMLEEIIRRLFHFPLKDLHHSEPDDHRLYHWAHQMGHENQNCNDLFPNCHISLIDILLGYS